MLLTTYIVKSRFHCNYFLSGMEFLRVLKHRFVVLKTDPFLVQDAADDEPTPENRIVVYDLENPTANERIVLRLPDSESDIAWHEDDLGLSVVFEDSTVSYRMPSLVDLVNQTESRMIE